jgi:feruloyl-CoA synthase
VTASSLLVSFNDPPVLLDWLPWHHTMGGNANLNGVLQVGGTLYIDDGRPTTVEAFQKTLDNIHEIKPTSLLSVPAALQMLVHALETDDGLRRAFFSRMARLVYAGATLSQDICDRLQAMAVESTGREILFGSGYGTTETGPGISVTHWASQGGGEIGLPVPGLTIKLVPFEDRYEVRVKGANVTPGYLRAPELTESAFDEEGYHRVGDLVQFIDPANPAGGLRFAGRLSENFKLTNGSWVATGELRLAVLEACRPFASDLVIAGQDRDDIRLMIWVSPQERQRLGAPAEGPIEAVHYRTLAGAITERLQAFNDNQGGKTHRIAAFRILHEAPSLGAGETTDKGYVNQRGVLQNRAELTEDLYALHPGPEVVRL